MVHPSTSLIKKSHHYAITVAFQPHLLPGIGLECLERPPGPSKYELETKLKQLRDFPVNTSGMPDEEILSLHTGLMSVKPGPDGVLHWFCSRAEPVTQELAIFLTRLHAYKNDKVQEWRERMIKVWRGCADCIKSMDEAKRTSRTT